MFVFHWALFDTNIAMMNPVIIMLLLATLLHSNQATDVGVNLEQRLTQMQMDFQRKIEAEYRVFFIAAYFVTNGAIFTACGKVMFSQPCVKNSVHRVMVCPSMQWAWGVHPVLGRHPLWADITLGKQPPPHPRWPLKWVVRSLLECILVYIYIYKTDSELSINLDYFLQLRIGDLEEKVKVLTAAIESMVIEKVRGMQQFAWGEEFQSVWL